MARKHNQDHVDNFHEWGLYIPTRTIQFPCIDGDGVDVNKDSVDRTIANFHILEDLSNDPITFLLNSYGGDIHQAFALYDFIKGCDSPVIIKAYGGCMSGATIILQAGDKRLLAPSTTFMMHVGQTALDDHSNNVRRWVKFETEVLIPRMRNVYSSKIIRKDGESDRQLEKRLDKLLDFDTILTAQDVVDLGLADDILIRNKDN